MSEPELTPEIAATLFGGPRRNADPAPSEPGGQPSESEPREPTDDRDRDQNPNADLINALRNHRAQKAADAAYLVSLLHPPAGDGGES